MDKKTVHFWKFSAKFGSKTEKNRKKLKKTPKNNLAYLSQTTIAQKILTYLTHIKPLFARFRCDPN